jgi:hypothetical protein
MTTGRSQGEASFAADEQRLLLDDILQVCCVLFAAILP